MSCILTVSYASELYFQWRKFIVNTSPVYKKHMCIHTAYSTIIMMYSCHTVESFLFTGSHNFSGSWECDFVGIV